MGTNLKLALWNVEVLNHSPEIVTFIRIHDIDVMLISKAHYTDCSYYRIQSYTIIIRNIKMELPMQVL